MSRNILVIAAHPDDELLGCGGTLAKHSANGDVITSCIVCEGESLRGISQNNGQYTEQAASILGIQNTIHLKLPDQKLDTIPIVDVIVKIEKIINSVKPEIIYTHHNNDVNEDHKIVFNATLVAARPLLDYIKAIYSFYTSSSTEWGYPRNFNPDTWVDISNYLNLKLEAMNCYKTELKSYPHPRSLKSLKYNSYHEGSKCLMESAESFMTIRRCIRDDQEII
jgi:LmbE family N-acetylglucosaminyl deacetylase